MTEQFKSKCRQPTYADRRGRVTNENNNLLITDKDYLVNFELLDDCYMEGSIIGTTNAKSINIETLDNYEIVDECVSVETGITYDENNEEYIDLGTFFINKEDNNQTTNNSSFKGKDRLIELDKKYICTISDIVNATIEDFYRDVCNQVGFTPKTYNFINSDLLIGGNPFTNNETCRQVISDIAEVACSFVKIDSNTDEIDLVWFDDNISETFTKDDYSSLTLNQKYGPVNSVVIKESQIEGENVVMEDSESITQNGEWQVAILDNYFLFTESLRREAIPAIYQRLLGFTYYDCSFDTDLGRPYLKSGNKIRVEKDDGTFFDTYILSHTFKYDGAFHSSISSPSLTKSETKLKNDYGSIADRFRKVEVSVNKAEGKIESIIEDNERNFTEITQNISNVITNVQNSGGSNLLKNSVMFAYDSEGKPNDWILNEPEQGDNDSLTIQSSSEALSAGSASGHIFTLNGKSVTQRVIVKEDDSSIPEDKKTYYTFSTKIKKNITGSCYVKISNSNEEYLISVDVGESPYYSDYEISGLLPKNSYYDITFYGSNDSDATFTDNMFSIGNYKTQWQQASGEIMNTQVNIDVNGVTVKSSQYQGNYTVMSPLEFSGYANINGVVTKIFTLNNDTTEVEKLKSRKEINMFPLKIVPITEGAKQGWAFVPTGSNN